MPPLVRIASHERGRLLDAAGIGPAIDFAGPEGVVMPEVVVAGFTPVYQVNPFVPERRVLVQIVSGRRNDYPSAAIRNTRKRGRLCVRSVTRF